MGAKIQKARRSAIEPTEFKITPGTAYIPELRQRFIIEFERSLVEVTHPIICPTLSIVADTMVTSRPRT